MSNLKIFIRTYWQNARSTLEFMLFMISLTLFFGPQITTLARPIGEALMFFVVLISGYRTWDYQYKQTQGLIELYGKDLTFDDLSDVQKAILYGMNSQPENKITRVSNLSGGEYRGIGNVNYTNDEIGAGIVELVKMEVLRIDGHDKNNKPTIYKPTSLGLKILRSLDGN